MWKECGREEVKSGHKIENSFKLVCTNCKCSQWEAYEIHQNWHWHRASMGNITITQMWIKLQINEEFSFLIKIHLSARNLIHYIVQYTDTASKHCIWSWNRNMEGNYHLWFIFGSKNIEQFHNLVYQILIGKSKRKNSPLSSVRCPMKWRKWK